MEHNCVKFGYFYNKLFVVFDSNCLSTVEPLYFNKIVELILNFPLIAYG